MKLPFSKLTTADIDRKVDELTQKRSKNSAEANSIQAHVTKLEAELSSAEFEAVLEDSPTAAKSAAELKPRIEKLKSKARELAHEADLIDSALSKLRESRASAEQTEIKDKFQAKAKELLALVETMDAPLLAFAEKARKATAISSELQAIALPHTHTGSSLGPVHYGPSRCNDDFRDALYGALRYRLRDSSSYYLIQIGDGVTKSVEAVDGSIATYLKSLLESELRRLSGALENKLGAIDAIPESADELILEDEDLAKSE